MIIDNIAFLIITVLAILSSKYLLKHSGEKVFWCAYEVIVWFLALLFLIHRTTV